MRKGILLAMLGCSLLGGCATFHGVPEQSKAKGFLANDAVRNLRYLTGCRGLQVTSVVHRSSSDDVQIRHPGSYLVAGTLVEDWTVAGCGSEQAYRLIMQGSPGGHLFSIGKL
jgi:hypothetical protein